MKEPRRPLKSKLTKAGKIRGRPVGKGGALSIDTTPAKTRTKAYRAGERRPESTLELNGGPVRPVGPLSPGYTKREVRRSRPKLSRNVALRRIIEAEVAKRHSPKGIVEPKRNLAVRIAEAKGAANVSDEADRISRWLRDPTRSEKPWK